MSAKVAGSVALTSKSRFFMTRVRASAAANPSATRISARLNLILNLMMKTISQPFSFQGKKYMSLSIIRKIFDRVKTSIAETVLLIIPPPAL